MSKALEFSRLSENFQPSIGFYTFDFAAEGLLQNIQIQTPAAFSIQALLILQIQSGRIIHESFVTRTQAGTEGLKNFFAIKYSAAKNAQTACLGQFGWKFCLIDVEADAYDAAIYRVFLQCILDQNARNFLIVDIDVVGPLYLSVEASDKGYGLDDSQTKALVEIERFTDWEKGRVEDDAHEDVLARVADPGMLQLPSTVLLKVGGDDKALWWIFMPEELRSQIVCRCDF